MDTEQTSAATEATDAQQNEISQETVKTYTQREVDDMIAGMKSSLSKKLLKPYEGLGDPSELRALREQAERREQEQAMKRGEFEKILQEKISAKDAEISRRDEIIRQYRVDTPLVTAAARARSVNPEQVRTLLKPYIRVNEDGEPEVIDDRGQVRYNDAGHPVSIDDFVTGWLNENPHFVQPTPATTAGRSSIQAPQERLDLSKLDMKNPEHRRVYAEYRKQRR